ncbi:acyl-CoA dehydrogenase family protein [Duganella sp. Root1480D1]|uniref:acyl-CoA dehydrogenase family protein n=1 Tax=Duganella sp. Root1480D1 TaxID=1736471 RepID=UPI00070E8CC8|nr:acyl-CoA dehydrogenase family protein [Duganella sp. Root1480D1]KQZ32627.1 monooxygenase [Duganella sp. Root1480D1]
MTNALLKPQPLDPLAIAEELASSFSASAVERDRQGGHAARERRQLRESGLLTLSVPREFGGEGASWITVNQVVRILARADSALAHLFGFHHLQLAGIQLYGSARQQRELLTATVEQGLFWGNALNPLDQRTVATEQGDGFVLSGVKSFSSGSVGSDWLTVSAWHAPTQSALIGVLPSTSEGVSIRPDWDAFGQKQTDSGSVEFRGVALPAGLVLQPPGQKPSPRATLRSQVAQLIMANLYLGIAEGAFEAARSFTSEQSRPWFASNVAAATEDPFVQHRYGELWTLLRPAAVLAGHAALELDAVLGKGALVTERERGELAISVAEAKVLSHRAGIEVSNQLFELTGARATSSKLGLDRFWRNVRVHTLHDPIDYKYRDLGRYALHRTLPEPTAYS